MQFRRLLITGTVCFSAAITFAQNLPSTLPLATREHQPRGSEPGGVGFVFNLEGKQYEAKITLDQIETSPEWTFSEPLPVTPKKAEELARVQLRKLINDDSAWEVTEFNLRRFGNEEQAKWYCTVKLMPKLRIPGVIPDMCIVPICLSGEVGRIRLFGNPHIPPK